MMQPVMKFTLGLVCIFEYSVQRIEHTIRCFINIHYCTIHKWLSVVLKSGSCKCSDFCELTKPVHASTPLCVQALH